MFSDERGDVMGNVAQYFRNQGEARGEARGKAEGIVEGIVEGGKQCSQLIALKLSQENVSLSVIVKCTGLSEAVVRDLQKQAELSDT